MPGPASLKALIFSAAFPFDHRHSLLPLRIALGTNAVERCIRPFGIGRRNWLFADTPKGLADAMPGGWTIETVLGLIETAPVWMPPAGNEDEAKNDNGGVFETDNAAVQDAAGQ